MLDLSGLVGAEDRVSVSRQRVTGSDFFDFVTVSQ